MQTLSRPMRLIADLGNKVYFGGNGFHELPILPIDAETTGSLPWRHNDPFDRMLVAQARRIRSPW
jgi:PIN domain nuclease of toxin-antitoxin system